MFGRMMRVLRLVRLAGISIPSVTVAKFVIEEPSSNPIWAVISGASKVPVVTCVLVTRLGNCFHSLILGLFDNVAPVVWRFPLAVLL
jgi:hypothetical protein